MQVLSGLCFSLFLWRIVWRTISSGEAEVDLRHCWHQLLYAATSPHTRRWRRRGSRGWCRRRSQGGSGRRCGRVPVAEGRGSGATLALWSLTVSIIATVLSTWISLTAIWEFACCHHPAGWHSSGRSPRCYLFFWPVWTAGHSPIFSRTRRPYTLLLLYKRRYFKPLWNISCLAQIKVNGGKNRVGSSLQVLYLSARLLVVPVGRMCSRKHLSVTCMGVQLPAALSQPTRVGWFWYLCTISKESAQCPGHYLYF